MTSTRETPIDFIEAFIPDILSGRKTQTRRPIKISDNTKGLLFDTCNTCLKQVKCDISLRDVISGIINPDSWCEKWPSFILLCPYGAPGNHLWVREPWLMIQVLDIDTGLSHTNEYFYMADAHPADKVHKIWQSQKIMPKAASRINLVNKDVRYERVQDITTADIIKEGFKTKLSGQDAERDLRSQWKSSWCDIYGLDSWERNDLVWAITFEVSSVREI